MCIICMASVLKFKLLFNLCLVSIFVYMFYFNKTFMIALETKFSYAIIKIIEIPFLRKKIIATSGNVVTFFFQQSLPAIVAAILISRKFVLSVTLRRQTL